MHRMADATEWHDPATGYRRRQITGPRFPADIAEVRLPPVRRVPYPAAFLAFQREAVRVLDGRLTFHEGAAVHGLNPGDSIEVDEPVPHVFADTSDVECRYAAILTRVERRGISCIRPASPVPRTPQLLHQLQKPRHIP